MEKEQLELIRRIASVVGHELRNPLAVINNSTYFLKGKLAAQGELDPKVEKHLGIVSSEIARLDGMISDILSYSRPLELRPAPGSLNAAVEAVVGALSLPAGFKVEKSLAEPAPSAPIDAPALQDALARVLVNSLDAMPGGGTVRVSTGAKPGPYILVEDDGPGILPENLGRVLEPFFTTKPKGLGLGLAMARRVVLGLGGRLEVENRPKGGAAVRFRW